MNLHDMFNIRKVKFYFLYVLETCALKPDRGPCDLKITRWYYNARTQSCKTFEYGGCFGNSNNFRTMEDCKTSCVQKV